MESGLKTERTKPSLKDYAEIVGPCVIDELRFIAGRLKGKSIQHVSSLSSSSEAAETLNRIVPLFKDTGLDASWDIIDVDSEFSEVTEKFHNALCGREQDLTDSDFESYIQASEHNIRKIKLRGDTIFIHDHQPLALIGKRKGLASKWVWRCHMDVSSPDERVWEFLSTFIEGYNAAVFSSPKFTKALNIPQFLVCPAIDPLSDKNRPLSVSEIDNVLYKYGIEKSKPIICQISRYDYLKDPVGVIETFKLVRKHVDCQLVLAGAKSTDDPETDRVLSEVKRSARSTPDVHILLLEEHSDIEINALQRASTVIVQKSIKEGFALTVTEALWKEKAVVASAVGGIPLQIKHKYSGLLCHSIEAAAMQLRQLLNNPEYAKKLGANGKIHVMKNFLLTRLMREHMLVALALEREGDIINL